MAQMFAQSQIAWEIQAVAIPGEDRWRDGRGAFTFTGPDLEDRIRTHSSAMSYKFPMQRQKSHRHRHSLQALKTKHCIAKLAEIFNRYLENSPRKSRLS